MNKSVSRVFLNPEWTLKYVYQRFSELRATIDNCLRPDWKSDGGLSLKKYFDKMPGPRWSFETSFCRLNALAGSRYNLKPLKYEEWILTQLPPRKDFFPSSPGVIKTSKDGAFIRENGLPCGYYWATHGNLGIAYSQKSGGVVKLTCWPWFKYPRARELFFSGDALTWGYGKEKNKFEKNRLLTFGFENYFGRNDTNISRLALESRILMLEVSGEEDVWVEFDLNTVVHLEGRLWKVLGWDKEHYCYGIYVGDIRNPAAGSPIHPPKMSIEESKIPGAGMDPYEAAPDVPTCGNLYFVFTCGIEKPKELHGENLIRTKNSEELQYYFFNKSTEFPEGKLRWVCKKNLKFLMAVGSTYQEAVANLEKARNGLETLWLRRLENCINIAKRCPKIKAQNNPNLETMITELSQQLNSLVIEDNVPLKGLPDRAFIDGWVNLEAMPALMHMGENKKNEKTLDFLYDLKHSGPHGEVSPGWNYDWTPDIQGSLDQPQDDAGLLILTGFQQWRCPNDNFVNGRYCKGKQLLEFMIEHADPRFGLLIDWGIGDGCAEDLGMKGLGYVAGTNSLWYVAVRTWEILAMQVGDFEFAKRLQFISRKIQQNFQRFFYDKNGSFLCFAVYPKTLEKMRVFDIYNLWGWYFPFAYELLDSVATQKIAETIYKYGFSHEWKTIRQQFPGNAPGCSPYPTVRQNISAANYYAFGGSFIRLARHSKALKTMKEFLEFHYSKFLSFPEAFNMWQSITDEEHASWGSWFIHNTAGAYQFIIECLFGINAGPGGLSLLPVGLDMEMSLLDYRYGTSSWDFHLVGKGEWPKSIRVDDREVVGAWCLPKDLSRGGKHNVEIVFSKETPTKPVIIDICGLSLEEPIKSSSNSIEAVLTGPGRAFVRYYSPSDPYVKVNGKQVFNDWSKISKEGRVEIVSAVVPVNLKVEI